jgi:hypothetical protein
VKFRGSTVLDATPRPNDHMFYPFYRHAQMKAGPPPFVRKQSYTAAQLLYTTSWKLELEPLEHGNLDFCPTPVINWFALL